MEQIYTAIICHNDEPSSSFTWLDCLQTDSDVFILLSESNQAALLKIYFILILLTVMYQVAIYQKIELLTISSQVKLIVTDNC